MGAKSCTAQRASPEGQCKHRIDTRCGATHVADGEPQRVNLDSDILNFKHAALVADVGAAHDNLDRDALAAQEHVREPLVVELGEARLLVVVERDVAEVGLDLREREGEAVVELVGDRAVGRQLEEVLGLEFDDALGRGEEGNGGGRWATYLGKRFLPCNVKFSMTKSNALSEYSIRGIGMNFTWETRVGRMTLRTSFHN